MDRQDVIQFLTNVPDSQFQQAATEKALQSRQSLEDRDKLKEEYEKKKQSVLQVLGNNSDFKWFVQNEILPFTIPAPLMTTDIDGRQKYDIIRADVLRNLFTDIISNMRRS